MKIQAIGGCCKKSTKNYENVCQAVLDLGLNIAVDHVSDMKEIIKLGVLSTPALAINGNVISSGRLLSVEQIKELIRKNQ